MKRVLKGKKNISFQSFIQLPGIRLKGISMNDDQFFVSAKIASRYGFCPVCGSRSKRLHSYYCRKLKDLPIISRSVNIELTVRKIFCDNPKCSKKVFSRQLPDKVVPYSRRTSRANERLLHLSRETSANKGSWISEQMRLRASSSTCLRIMHECNVAPPTKMTHSGIDDWAYHKGHTYGTIEVDRETGKTVVVKNPDIPENEENIIQKIIDPTAGSTVQADENKCTLIKKARDLNKENYSMRSIARILNLDFRTVRKYIHTEKGQILTIRKTFVDYTEFLDDLIEGYRKGESLGLIFRKIKIKGFKGSLRGLTIRFGKLYRGRMERKGSCVTKKGTIKPPGIFSCRKICIYLTNKNYDKILSPVEIGWYEHLGKENPILQSLWNLSSNFRSIFAERSIKKFHEWIQQVRQSDFRELRNFACGLQKDLKAVEASIIHDYHNGITEGCVNRLKNIKKQMYGRASFDLLRKKVIFSKCG